MASTLKNVVSFVAVPAGGQSSLPHLLAREGAGLVPDSVRMDNPLFSLSAADATNVTIQNNGAVALDCRVLCESWHTVDRNFVTQGQAALSPQPFADLSATAPLPGGVQPSTFVFRPGGATLGNIYATWPALYTDLLLIDGPKIIYFDDSLVSPCVVPAGGPYDMTEVQWIGHGDQGVPSLVTVSDGASFTSLLTFRNIYVTNLCTTSPMALANGDRIVIHDFADISTQTGVGAVAFFSGAALGAGEYAVLDLYNLGSIALNIPNELVIDMSAAAADFLFVEIGPRSHLGNNSIAANALCTVQTLCNSTSGFVLEQGGIAGTWTEIQRGYPQFNQVPGRGVAPAIANMGNQVSGSHLRLNATAGSFTQTMPEAFHIGISTELTTGRTCIVSETSGVNGITLDGYNAETIDGTATYWLPPGATMMFISDGVSNWTSVSLNPAGILNRQNTFTRAQGTAKVTLADAATIATDASLGNVFEVELGGNRVLGLPTNLVSGFTYMWIIKQDAGAPRTLTYNAIFKFPGGTAPTLSTGNNDVDIITAVYDGTILACVFQADFS